MVQQTGTQNLLTEIRRKTIEKTIFLIRPPLLSFIELCITITGKMVAKFPFLLKKGRRFFLSLSFTSRDLNQNNFSLSLSLEEIRSSSSTPPNHQEENLLKFFQIFTLIRLIFPPILFQFAISVTFLVFQFLFSLPFHYCWSKNRHFSRILGQNLYAC